MLWEDIQKFSCIYFIVKVLVWNCVVNIVLCIVYRMLQPHAVLLLSLAYLHTIHQYGIQCSIRHINASFLHATYISGNDA